MVSKHSCSTIGDSLLMGFKPAQKLTESHSNYLQERMETVVMQMIHLHPGMLRFATLSAISAECFLNAEISQQLLDALPLHFATGTFNQAA